METYRLFIAAELPPRVKVELLAAQERLRRGGTSWVSGPAIPQGQGHWSRRVALALGNPVGQGGSAKWTPAAADDEQQGQRL